LRSKPINLINSVQNIFMWTKMPSNWIKFDKNIDEHQ